MARNFFPALYELDDHGEPANMFVFCSHPCRATYEQGGTAAGRVYQRDDLALPSDKNTCDQCSQLLVTGI